MEGTLHPVPRTVEDVFNHFESSKDGPHQSPHHGMKKWHPSTKWNTLLEGLLRTQSELPGTPLDLRLLKQCPKDSLVKALCEDLRVLGKQDFKHLLKWRMNIRKALSPSKKATSAVEHENKENEDDKILNEMEELTNAMERKKKRAKKILAKRQDNDKAQKALVKQMDAVERGYIDQELFALSSIKEKKELVVVDNNEHDDDAGDIGNSESEQATKLMMKTCPVIWTPRKKKHVNLSAFRKSGDSHGISYCYEDDPIIGHRMY